MILNITYQGRSADFTLELMPATPDREIQRIATELVRSGSGGGLHVPQLPDAAFEGFVIDRMAEQDRMYLRPRVPFG